MLAGLCIPFTYYGANRDQGTLFHFTGTLWVTISPDLLLARCNSIFGKGQQAVGAGVEWGCPVAYPRKAGQSLCPVGKEWGSSGAYFLPDDCHIPFFEQYCAIQHPYFSKPDIYAR